MRGNRKVEGGKKEMILAFSMDLWNFVQFILEMI